MSIYYHDTFIFPLPDGHRFPVQKYALLRQKLITEGVVRSEDLHIPPPASDQQLLLAHDAGYLQKVTQGHLSEKEIRRIGLPWSSELVERGRRSVSSTIAACRSALEDGVSINLGGGTHHAFADLGAGYCIFNDCAIAARVLQEEKLVDRVLIVDCDVHQGDGTALIFADDPTVFTFSIHGEKNYPVRKQLSDLDIPLPDGTDDHEFLSALERGIQHSMASAQADLVIYLAGADPYADDRLGRLSLSKAGLVQRDRLVFEVCLNARLPIAVVMSGGYGRQIHDTVEIHFNTVKLALELFARFETKNSIG